jgi:hypothetical protein
MYIKNDRIYYNFFSKMNPTKYIFTIPQIRIIRTENGQTILTQWHYVINNKTYKFFPKTWLFFTSLGLLWYYIYSCDKKSDNENKQRKLLNKTHDDAYNMGREQGIKYITSNKINADTLKPYVDMAIFLENQKQLKNSVEEMEKNKEQYRILLNNLQ